MAKQLIGRKAELTILNEALLSDSAEMIAVIGRRRVGKTFLISSAYENRINFKFTGIQNAPNIEQLQNFAFELTKAKGSEELIKTPSNWVEGFILLIQFLETKKTEEKLVVFIDELPWLSGRRSGFLRGLSFFWNSWAVNENINVVICGSAASWMIQKVVNNRGGLHNRITQYIHLKPFTLAETEAFLQYKNINLNRYQIAQLYMAIGGVPHYLEKVKSENSVSQIIDNLCFTQNGVLTNEFSKLYPALFENAEKHIAVIRTLAKKRDGMTRAELVEIGKLSNGGTLTNVLTELEQSDFISIYHPFGKKKKTKLYRLTDEYSLFYLKFIENNIQEGRQTWQQISQTQAYKIWSGYAFESLCIKHLPQIKKALEIGGVYTVSSSFYKKGTATEQGTQIDLVLDRKDDIINLFEMKFYNKTFSLSKDYAQQIKTKREIFETTTKTKKMLHWVILTADGFQHNEHSLGLIDNVLTLEDLFLVSD
jgi:hypothetical protein